MSNRLSNLWRQESVRPNLRVSFVAGIHNWREEKPQPSSKAACCAHGRKHSYDLSRGHAEVYRNAGDIPREIWKAGFSDSPKNFTYYELLERTMRADFDYRYLLVFGKDGRPIALQPLVISMQDLTITCGHLLSKSITRLRQYWPGFLETRILFAGCLVGDGKTGVIEPVDDAYCLVAEAVANYAEAEAISLIVFKDYPAALRDRYTPLLLQDYVRLAGFPPLEIKLDVPSFNEYFQKHLSKASRKDLRRKLRMRNKIWPPLMLEVFTDAEQIIDEIYPLYLSVARRSEVLFETFTREYFLEAGRLSPGTYYYFVWRIGGKAVAFSFCTVWNGTLYDNDIGLDYSVAQDLNLYFVTFHDLLDWAIARGLRRYITAPFNYDTKLRFGLTLRPVDIYVRHRSAVLNQLIRLFAPFFEPARTDPVLRQYRSVL